MAVRLRLVDLLTSLYAADRESSWTSLIPRKKPQPSSDSQKVQIRQALVMMIDDDDHSVRMHVAKAITSLFLTAAVGGVLEKPTNALTGTVSRDNAVLLSLKGQEICFRDVLERLRPAFNLPDGLDELSSEDQSVNRVASRIYTLLMEGCVSPVCERKVVSELVMSVGRAQIDSDIVTKVSYV